MQRNGFGCFWCMRTGYVLARIACIVMGSPAPHVMGVMADTLRATLRDLAQADARLYRGLAEITAATEAPALAPADDTAQRIAAAIALLEEHGYTVTR